ncbi:hypothetical protein DC498_18950 [Terrimonas sp.]|uniref:DUF4874 domain-containing protein n=1 Tax=Terrimonas sp. TaxID=1914338 RepID=UPI000D50716E|nr:DUF4874 domain-containing protein [Terrimonas sp.]PVD50670.1 hypothetical protein DC498_18950 [Terrimonas sp.]
MNKSLIIILLFTGLVSYAQQNDRVIKFRGLNIDDSAGKYGLWNPERGFRLEVATDIASKAHAFQPDVYPGITTFLDHENVKYASDSVSLVQTYFYLTGFTGKNISPEGFSDMQMFFDRLRTLGKKAILRFAYEKDFLGRAAKGPTANDIQRHAEQLRPFLEKNKDVILVVQAGMIGAWGEWHSSFHHLESSEETKRQILEIICNMVPADRQIQVRVPAYKNLLDKDSVNYNRISFHDDFIVIQPHEWDGGMHEGTPFFNQIVKESPYLLVDGELPWGSWSVNKDKDNPGSSWLVNGVQTARQLFLQHYTSLSAIHNYKENNGEDKFSMMYWKETPITEQFLTENKMPFSPDYFMNNKGQKTGRNVFDYIRDHLGYRVELQSLKYITDKQGVSVDISFINRGFSTIINKRPVYLVLIDKNNKVIELKTNADVVSWQPYAPSDTACTPLVHHIRYRVNNNILKSGSYRLGLWIPDDSKTLRYDPRYAIRCANGNINWQVIYNKYGINVLSGELFNN